MEEVLNCPVCMEPYNYNAKRPKVLSCGHTFCLSCLEVMKFCPEDRKVFNKCPVDLADNFAVLRLLESHEKAPTQPKFWCVECGKIADSDCEDHHSICKLQHSEHFKRIRNAKIATIRQVDLEVAEIQTIIDNLCGLQADLDKCQKWVRADLNVLGRRKDLALEERNSIVNTEEHKLTIEMLNMFSSCTIERLRSLSSGVSSLYIRSSEGSRSLASTEHVHAVQSLLYRLSLITEDRVKPVSKQKVFAVNSLPDWALRMILNCLSLGDVVSFGQVCQRWRNVVKDEAVWRNRCLNLSKNTFYVSARVLRFAPCLGRWEVDSSVICDGCYNYNWTKAVIDSLGPCKIRALHITSAQESWCVDVLKKCAPFLEDLEVSDPCRGALEVVDGMSKLQRIVLRSSGKNHGFRFQNRSPERSTLLHLDARFWTGHSADTGVFSLIMAHKFSLREVQVVHPSQLPYTYSHLCSLQNLTLSHCGGPFTCSSKIITALKATFCNVKILCECHNAFYCRGKDNNCEMPRTLASLYPDRIIVCKDHT